MRQKWVDTGLQVQFDDSGRVPGEHGCIVKATNYQHGLENRGGLVITAPEDDFSFNRHATDGAEA